MFELFKIVLTACFTLAGGVLLLVFTQIITRFVVDPLLDFRRLLGEIAYTLILYANFLFNPAFTASTLNFQKRRNNAECWQVACTQFRRLFLLTTFWLPRGLFLHSTTFTLRRGI
jgi:hypothetical protein